MTRSSSEPPPRATLLLGRHEVASLLDLDECIVAVEEAFRLHADGKSLPPAVLGVASVDGGFHVKAAGLMDGRTWFAVKCNGNFLRNAERFGMPRIQGLVILCDGVNGYPLAVMDSIEITIQRTGAATAIAARHLSRPESEVATIIGCGSQGFVQVRALSRVRSLKRVFALDLDPNRSERLAAILSPELGIEIESTRDLASAVRRSDLCVTCTPSRRPFLMRDHVGPGTFVAAVGADNHDKQELDASILAAARVVTDSTAQCAEIGELHHAIEAGLMTREDVHAELAEIVAGRGHAVSPRAVVVFDSTGTALQDVAAAVTVYEKARRTGAGLSVDLLG